MAVFRQATDRDLPALARLRWAFKTEDEGEPTGAGRDEFIERCTAFLSQGFTDGSWVFWVAEQDGEIVGHIFVQIIKKVPSPGQSSNEYGYVTNVYTTPSHRGKGVGAKLLTTVDRPQKAHDIVAGFPDRGQPDLLCVLGQRLSSPLVLAKGVDVGVVPVPCDLVKPQLAEPLDGIGRARRAAHV